MRIISLSLYGIGLIFAIFLSTIVIIGNSHFQSASNSIWLWLRPDQFTQCGFTLIILFAIQMARQVRLKYFKRSILLETGIAFLLFLTTWKEFRFNPDYALVAGTIHILLIVIILIKFIRSKSDYSPNKTV